MPQVQLQDGIQVPSNRPHKKNAHSWDWSEHVYGWLLQRKTQNISEPSPIQTAPTGAKVTCPDYNKLFGAVRNMKKHWKAKHKSNNTSQSNETIRDTNLNPDNMDIDNIQFEICA